MRLIDADELIKQIQTTYCKDCKDCNKDKDFFHCRTEQIIGDIHYAPTIDLWHYPDNGEYPTKPNLCIRYVDKSGDEFIGYTEWYYPSEDEVGYGSLLISIICNGDSVDPSDIEMWCELPYPPKEKV